MAHPITITGYLAAQPQVSWRGERARVRVTVLTPRNRKTAAGWEQGEPTPWRLEILDDMAINVASSLKKGHAVIALAEPFTDKWTGKDGIENRFTFYRVAAMGPDLARQEAKVSKADAPHFPEAHGE